MAKEKSPFQVVIPSTPFSFLLLASRPYRLRIFIALTAVIVASSFGNLVPYIFKRIVDSVNGIPGFGPENVWFWAGTYILFSLFTTLSWRASGFSGLVWATGVRKTGREILTKHVLDHSHKYFSNRFAGAIASKLTQASEGIKTMTENILWQWLSGLDPKFRTPSLYN